MDITCKTCGAFCGVSGHRSDYFTDSRIDGKYCTGECLEDALAKENHTRVKS